MRRGPPCSGPRAISVPQLRLRFVAPRLARRSLSACDTVGVLCEVRRPASSTVWPAAGKSVASMGKRQSLPIFTAPLTRPFLAHWVSDHVEHCHRRASSAVVRYVVSARTLDPPEGIEWPYAVPHPDCTIRQAFCPAPIVRPGSTWDGGAVCIWPPPPSSLPASRPTCAYRAFAGYMPSGAASKTRVP